VVGSSRTCGPRSTVGRSSSNTRSATAESVAPGAGGWRDSGGNRAQ
jgi:hypothetical protein